MISTASKPNFSMVAAYVQATSAIENTHLEFSAVQFSRSENLQHQRAMQAVDEYFITVAAMRRGTQPTELMSK